MLEEMKSLIWFVNRYLKKHNDDNGDLHLNCCKATADRFNLWMDEDESDDAQAPKEFEQFPAWLSYVVYGQIKEIGINA